MAATLKQTLANRLNALRSTGPKTEEGKSRSSQNALKHGLSRIGARPPAMLAEWIAERKDQWHNDYRPEGSAQQWQFDRLVAESVRLDVCEARILASRVEHAARAAESWDDDRAAEAASLGSRLSRDPNRIQPLLLQSKHGVCWLLERWDEVAASLRLHEGWTFETWNLSMDLLGVPLASRDGSGPWDLDPEDKTAGPGLDLVRQATAALRDRLDAYLDDRDARQRLDAQNGLDAIDPPPIRLLERYAADARRRILNAVNELRRMQSDRPRSPSREAALPPGPRPERSGVRSRPDPEPSPRPPKERTEPIGSAPSASTASARNEPATDRSNHERSLVQSVFPARSAPLNRRARRAQAARSRRS